MDLRVQFDLLPRLDVAADKSDTLMDESDPDVLAYMNFPAPAPRHLHSTIPIKRLNCEMKPRAEVVGIFPNEVPSATSLLRSCSSRTTKSCPARSVHDPGKKA